MKKLITITLLATLIICVLYTCSSDKKNVKAEFEKIGISLNNDFIIEKYKGYGVTDYMLDIDLVLDSTDFNTVSEFIRTQPHFFLGDTTSDVKLFNNYPHLKGGLFFWEKFKTKEPSYEYFRIEANTKTKQVKYHYLDEG
jgi:hypothetical protein